MSEDIERLNRRSGVLGSGDGQPERTADSGPESERALEETRLRLLLETTKAMPWEADARTGQFTYVGPQAVKLLGYPLEQWYEKEFWGDRIHPDDRGWAVQFCLESAAKTQDYEFEYRMVRADGTIVWIHDIVNVVSRDGAPELLRGFMIDVTERKQRDQRLGEERGLTNRIIESLPGLFFMLDRQGRLRRWNKNREVVAGYSADELANMHALDLISPEDRTRVEQTLEKGFRDGAFSGEYHLLTKDGRRIPHLAHGAVVRIDGREYAIGVGVDVSHRKRMEQQLREALAQVEQLKERLEQENVYLRREIQVHHRHGEIIGDSDAIRKVLSQVEQVARTNSSVLVLGETGVGKELIARAIHRLSVRGGRAMVTVNCATLPSTLIEAELFGREKGAYTGALSRQVGRFEVADGSTIFLDEIGDLPPDLQAKLLRVLQEGQFERLGSTRTIRVDVRVIAASNRDLAKAVQDRTFREDLYYRLNVFPISVPPLRERREDIPLLVWGFVREFEAAMGKSIEAISRTSLEALQQYDWPGNIRELRNVIERAMILSAGAELQVRLPRRLDPSGPDGLALEDVERRHILAVLERTGWRVRGGRGAASVLGLKPTTLEAKMQRLGIRRSDTASDWS